MLETTQQQQIESQVSALSIIPTADQSRANDNIARFLKSPDRFFCLSGSAGTGKTYLLSEVPGKVEYGDVIGCGPTHKSVKVLSERLQGTECCTIHSFLGLRPKRSKDKTILVQNKNYDPSTNYAVRVVLLDEASMISSDVLKFIVEDAVMWDRKYILVGDKYQLNPVNEMNTPCFNLDFGSWHSELFEIVRQAQDNPVIKTATAIRQAIIANKQPDVLPGVHNDTGVFLMRKAEWLAKLAEHVGSDDPDSFRILAYRNDSVRDYNKVVRGILGLPLDVPFSPGEIVVVNEAYSQGDEVILNTGVELEVVDMMLMEHFAYPELRGWSVQVKIHGSGVIEERFNVLNHEVCGADYKRIVESMVEKSRNSGDWRPYYAMQEFWCDLRPLHALTVHKSQGSTFENVFVDYRDIYTNRKAAEADRCLYVAMTRPRNNVYVLI